MAAVSIEYPTPKYKTTLRIEIRAMAPGKRSMPSVTNAPCKAMSIPTAHGNSCDNEREYQENRNEFLHALTSLHTEGYVPGSGMCWYGLAFMRIPTLSH